MTKTLTEFKMFLTEGNALDMAVGVITGAAMGTVVNSLVKDILTPPLGLLIGGMDFHDIKIPLGDSASINIGVFLNALLGFLITMFTIFMIIRITNKLRKHVIRSRACPYCKTNISPAATRCPNCTSKIQPTSK